MAGYLEALMRERHFQRDIPRSVLVVLVRDAYQQAVTDAKDSRARWGTFYKNIDRTADNVIAAFEQRSEVDPRIVSVLTFNNLLIPGDPAEKRYVPNHSPDPTPASVTPAAGQPPRQP
jgi:hypothetical protein